MSVSNGAMESESVQPYTERSQKVERSRVRVSPTAVPSLVLCKLFMHVPTLPLPPSSIIWNLWRGGGVALKSRRYTNRSRVTMAM